MLVIIIEEVQSNITAVAILKAKFNIYRLLFSLIISSKYY